jgi:hypothetical protein
MVKIVNRNVGSVQISVHYFGGGGFVRESFRYLMWEIFP